MLLSDQDEWLLSLDGRELLDLIESLDPDAGARVVLRLHELADIEGAAVPIHPRAVDLDEPYTAWMDDVLPTYFPAPLAPHHHEMWDWGWRLRRNTIVEALIAVLARGGAKSTTVEGICAAAGARQVRRFVLYVCATQQQANDHVDAIGSMLQSSRFAERYPDMATPLRSTLGQIRAWRQTRLRTASGFTVQALGLDAAVRGIRIEDARPDLIVLDDIDDKDDGDAGSGKKIETLAKDIIPAGSWDVAVVGVQNLVHPDSVFAKLLDGRTDLLRGRTTIGPIPALRGAAFEQDPTDGGWDILAGEPTWVGQSVHACQAMMDLIGYTAFDEEAQHNVTVKAGGMYDHLSYLHCTLDEVPVLDTVTVWVDPAVTDKDTSDSHGIQVDGRGSDGRLYRLWSWEQRTSPLESIKLALRQAHRWGASTVGIETDQGGLTWQSVYRDALVELALDELDPLPLDSLACRRAGIREFVGKAPTMLDEKAGQGHGSKVERSSRMLADYERPNRMVHVLNDEGTHEILEAALRRFGPAGVKPFDLADVAYWSWWYLRIGAGSIENPNDQDGRVPTGASAMTNRSASTGGRRVPTGAGAVTRTGQGAHRAGLPRSAGRR